MQTEPDRDIPDGLLLQAVDCIRAGGVLVYPTDTVYGLGGDAGSEEATQRIRRLKGVQDSKPLLVLTDEWERASDWILPIGNLTTDLMAIAREYPITILFPASPAVPKSLLGHSKEVGIRLCRHAFCVHLIQSCETMLSSTSANYTGVGSPSRFEEIDPGIRGASDLAIDGGTLSGLSSTIVRPEGDHLNVLREGSVQRNEIVRLLS